MSGAGEFEPKDQRNVTGQPSPVKDRWHNDAVDPPEANGEPAEGIRSLASDRLNPGPNLDGSGGAGKPADKANKGLDDEAALRRAGVYSGTQRDERHSEE